MMVTVKEAMNEVEKSMNPSTYTTIFYLGWRGKRLMKHCPKGTPIPEQHKVERHECEQLQRNTGKVMKVD